MDISAVDVASRIYPMTRRYSNRNAEIKDCQDEGMMDLYCTLYEDVQFIIPFIEALKHSECYGEGSFGKVSRENEFTKIVETDCYTLPVKVDFLTDNLPDHDFVITNPPFYLKHEVLQRAYTYLSGKPFCFLWSLNTLSYMGTSELFLKYGVKVVVFCPFVSKFARNGEVKKYSSCGVFGNLRGIDAGEVHHT